MFVRPIDRSHPPVVRRGLTLVEVMVALTVLTVSVYLLSSTITTVMMHGESKRERTIAVDAVMNQIEVMRSQKFEDLLALYNADIFDDPGTPGSAPGVGFAVFGLDPVEGDADGLPGRVWMPSQTAQLMENVNLPELSMPRDLDGNLRVDTQDHAEDYIVLPVRVQVEWSGRGGDRSFEMSTMFAKLKKLEM